MNVPPLSPQARDYLRAFDRWLTGATPQRLDDRRAALDRLTAAHRIELNPSRRPRYVQHFKKSPR